MTSSAKEGHEATLHCEPDHPGHVEQNCHRKQEDWDPPFRNQHLLINWLIRGMLSRNLTLLTGNMCCTELLGLGFFSCNGPAHQHISLSMSCIVIVVSGLREHCPIFHFPPSVLHPSSVCPPPFVTGLTSQLSSIIWWFRPSKPYIFWMHII